MDRYDFQYQVLDICKCSILCTVEVIIHVGLCDILHTLLFN